MDTVLKIKTNDSGSFQTKITQHLMKECYNKLIRDYGNTEAHNRMSEAWSLIEQEMQENGLTDPLPAAKILFKKCNYDRLLHTLYYAAIYWKENESLGP